MKIIRHGDLTTKMNNYDSYMTFICISCGCKFEIDDNEMYDGETYFIKDYEVGRQYKYDEAGYTVSYWRQCPECKMMSARGSWESLAVREDDEKNLRGMALEKLDKIIFED